MCFEYVTVCFFDNNISRSLNLLDLSSDIIFSFFNLFFFGEVYDELAATTVGVTTLNECLEEAGSSTAALLPVLVFPPELR